MNRTRMVVVVIFFAVLAMTIQTGCWSNRQNPAGPEIASTPKDSGIVPSLSFKFVLPPASESGKTPSSSIVAAVASVTPTVTAKLILVNVGNTVQPSITLSKTASVASDGSAVVVFSAIPPLTCVADIHIAGGSIGGYADFTGASDLGSGKVSTIEVAPQGSKMTQAVIASVIEKLLSTPDLNSKITTGLAVKVSQSISGINVNSATLYDEALAYFLNYQPGSGTSMIAQYDTASVVLEPQGNTLIVKDEVLVTFKTPPTDQELAQAAINVKGTLIASFPALKTYQFKVPSSDVTTLVNSVNSLQQQAVGNNLNFNYDLHQVMEAMETPNDPDYTKNWGMTKIRAVDTWGTIQGSNIAVAVVDTGIRSTHEDLSAVLDKADSRNFTTDYGGAQNNFEDGKGHGTHVSGIIAASLNNGKGIVGVAPNIKIVAVKVLDNTGQGSEVNVALGITYASDLSFVRVINLSLGRPGPISRVMKNAIDYAVDHGKLVVVAAGNNNDDADFFTPAYYQKVFCVGATTQTDARASFSNYGASVDVSAPGDKIYSCYNTSDSSYAEMSGTSMATPFVSGLAGAVFSVNPGLTADEVKNLIYNNADLINTDQPISGRRINVLKTITAAGGGTINQAPTVALTGPTILDAGGTGIFNALATDTDDTALTFTWTSNSTTPPQATVSNLKDSTASWKAPDISGTYLVSCKAVDGKGAFKEASVEVFVRPRPVSINFLNPTSGKAATEVIIAGANFGATKGGSTVQIASTSVTDTDIISWSDTQIKIRIPSVAVPGLVVVTVNGVISNGAPFDIDNAAPVISSLVATNLTETSATIEWTTDEGATTQVEYGPTTTYGTLTSLDSGITKSHSTALNSLGSNKTYHFRVKSKDSTGNEGVSADQTFNTINTLPTVSLTAPVNNAAFLAGANIQIAADAADTDGGIAKVEFWQGTTKLYDDATAPYAFTWVASATGQYSITAKAVDSSGGERVSAAVAVFVNSEPTVNIISPASGSVVTQGNLVTFTADASGLGAGIAKVEFYQGTTKLGEDSSAPFTCPWTPGTAGTYSITAKAIDTNNNAKTSTSFQLVVNAEPTVSMTSPANNTVVTTGANITLSANANDSDGTISKVEFFRDATKIGEDTSSPFSFSWIVDVHPGNYSLTAKATDNNGATKTCALVSMIVNALPTVSITSPTNNAVVNAGSNVTITADAADSDGTIAKVEFYQGSTLLGQSTSAPYSYLWSSPIAGNYVLTTKATDNNGATKTSAAVSMTVNTLPTVSITSPANNSVFTAGSSVTITVDAADSDGSIAKVEFFQGSTLLGQATSAPYSYTWPSPVAGNYTIITKATDNNGATKTSAAISMTVNGLPTVTITSPANNAIIDEGTSITISANATDSDGTVTKVEFYQGSALLGLATSAPFIYTWAGATAGNYILSAKTTDNLMAQTTSTGISITVNTKPTVSITGPTINQVFLVGHDVTVTASANDSDGSIAKVEFYQGLTKVQTKSSPPFTYVLVNPTVGSYTFFARAFDNTNSYSDSQSIPISVRNLPHISKVSLGNNHSYALANDGTVWGWGENASGLLGCGGANTARLSPVQITGLPVITRLAAGDYHCLALDLSGNIWAWGQNTYGQIGDGSNIDRSSPVKISGISNATAICANNANSYALKSDGTVCSWGRNDYGMLGDGT
ncbi:MAG: S8 family serine peptidase, partial [Candidatus Riflebacteria bacterium]|nr:S8 family serine peptidase [Candidatus Riflebacteria bacterium]